MSKLDEFEKKLQELQEEMGIYLKVAVYKNVVSNEYCGVTLYADEERSVHLHKLIDIDLLDENEPWYKYYNKKESN